MFLVHSGCSGALCARHRITPREAERGRRNSLNALPHCLVDGSVGGTADLEERAGGELRVWELYIIRTYICTLVRQ